MKLKEFIQLAETHGATLEPYNGLGGYELTRGDIVDRNPVLIAYMPGMYSVELTPQELAEKDLTELAVIYRNASFVYPTEKDLLAGLELSRVD